MYSQPTRVMPSLNFTREVHYRYMYVKLNVHVCIIIDTCMYNEHTTPSFPTRRFETSNSLLRVRFFAVIRRLFLLQM